MEDRARAVFARSLLFRRRRRNCDRHERAASGRLRRGASYQQQNLDRARSPAAPEAEAEASASPADYYPKLTIFEKTNQLFHSAREASVSFLSVPVFHSKLFSVKGNVHATLIAHFHN